MWTWTDFKALTSDLYFLYNCTGLLLVHIFIFTEKKDKTEIKGMKFCSMFCRFTRSMLWNSDLLLDPREVPLKNKRSNVLTCVAGCNRTFHWTLPVLVCSCSLCRLSDRLLGVHRRAGTGAAAVPRLDLLHLLRHPPLRLAGDCPPGCHSWWRRQGWTGCEGGGCGSVCDSSLTDRWYKICFYWQKVNNTQPSSTVHFMFIFCTSLYSRISGNCTAMYISLKLL